MPISEKRLTKVIKAAFDNEKTKEDDQQASIDRLSQNIAKGVIAELVQGIDTANVTFILGNSGGTVTGTITIKATVEP